MPPLEILALHVHAFSGKPEEYGAVQDAADPQRQRHVRADEVSEAHSR